MDLDTFWTRLTGWLRLASMNPLVLFVTVGRFVVVLFSWEDQITSLLTKTTGEPFALLAVEKIKGLVVSRVAVIKQALLRVN